MWHVSNKLNWPTRLQGVMQWQRLGPDCMKGTCEASMQAANCTLQVSVWPKKFLVLSQACAVTPPFKQKQVPCWQGLASLWCVLAVVSMSTHLPGLTPCTTPLTAPLILLSSVCVAKSCPMSQPHCCHFLGTKVRMQVHMHTPRLQAHTCHLSAPCCLFHMFIVVIMVVDLVYVEFK